MLVLSGCPVVGAVNQQRGDLKQEPALQQTSQSQTENRREAVLLGPFTPHLNPLWQQTHIITARSRAGLHVCQPIF